MRVWQLQEAKSRFSEVFDRAWAEGPQKVTRRAKQAVVVLAEEQYQRLTSPEEHFVDRYRRLIKAAGPDLEVERLRSGPRKVEL
jgi:antitoxin Phd